jgi:hypothetical protein
MTLRLGDTVRGFLRNTLLEQDGEPLYPELETFRLWGVMLGNTFIGVTRRVRK